MATKIGKNTILPVAMAVPPRGAPLDYILYIDFTRKPKHWCANRDETAEC